MTIFAVLNLKVMVNKRIEIYAKRPNGKIEFGRAISLEDFQELDMLAFSDGLLCCIPNCKVSIEISNIDSYE